MKTLCTISLFLLMCCAGQAQIIHRVAGTVGVGGYSGVGGPATAAVIQNPQSVALDTFGNLYIADGDNNLIQKVDRAGIITTIAGTGGRGYSGDGGPAIYAVLNTPTGLSIDKIGNIYLADLGNSVVRVIDTAGIITTVVGSGIAGYSGDGGPATAATLNWPVATAKDTIGNLYISELGNNVVRKVTSAGIITTVAGDSINGYSGDGGVATDAELSVPYGIAVDNTGNLFIADSHNNVIRKVDTSGIITTIAGNGTAGYSGNGGVATAALLNSPFSIAINNSSIYIADNNNNVIRKIDTSGIISTVAGDGIKGYSDDNGLAIYAELTYPIGLAVDKYGDFYFGDVINFVVREVDISHVKEGINVINNESDSVNIFPNPVTNVISISSSINITSIVITNVVGEIVLMQSMNTSVQQLQVNVAGLLAGVYFIRVNHMRAMKLLKE